MKLGPSRKRLQDDYERKMTAYHEAGHALVAHMLPHADPVHRVSIVSRGRALGFTMTPPEQDKYQQTKSELLDDMAVMMGGREAEELVFGELTAGASSDIERATVIARAMVVDFGMSRLGPVYMGPQYETTEYGRAMFEPSQVSQKVAADVDEEIGRFVAEAQRLAREVLKKNRKVLDRVGRELEKQETLDGDDFAKLVGVPKVRVERKGDKVTK